MNERAKGSQYSAEYDPTDVDSIDLNDEAGIEFRMHSGVELYSSSYQGRHEFKPFWGDTFLLRREFWNRKVRLRSSGPAGSLDVDVEHLIRIVHERRGRIRTESDDADVSVSQVVPGLVMIGPDSFRVESDADVSAMVSAFLYCAAFRTERAVVSRESRLVLIESKPHATFQPGAGTAFGSFLVLRSAAENPLVVTLDFGEVESSLGKWLIPTQDTLARRSGRPLAGALSESTASEVRRFLATSALGRKIVEEFLLEFADLANLPPTSLKTFLIQPESLIMELRFASLRREHRTTRWLLVACFVLLVLILFRTQ